jgi:hypothetical protein
MCVSADLATGGDGVTRQAAVKDDHRATKHRGCLEESVPWIRSDAQLGDELSYNLTNRQDQDAARVDEQGHRLRHLQNEQTQDLMLLTKLYTVFAIYTDESTALMSFKVAPAHS